MARLYAQLCTLVFALLGIGGLFLGDAGSSHNGVQGGNLHGIVLQLTWARDAVDILLAALFAYVGFVASRQVGRILVFGAGVFLMALAAVGLKAGSGGWASMRFPATINVLDLVTGVLAVLSALGTIEDAEPYAGR